MRFAALEPLVSVQNVSLHYGKFCALSDISLAFPTGCLTGVIGPDGVGKSSLLSLIAGARKIQSGSVFVFGNDIADADYRAKVCQRIAYMPQGLGKNLYPDLSVRENIEFFGRLFGEPKPERERRIASLLNATGLEPFPDRTMGKLSGGMRQKLGLCCSLVHEIDLLILDEPTTGVDPLSRRQFWRLIARMRLERPSMSVIIATAYMEEAEQCDWLVAMNGGRILATGSPAQFKARTQSTSLEASFVSLLPKGPSESRKAFTASPRGFSGRDAVIVARHLTKQFGTFTAVNDVNFVIERGEIFGFLGSNGCGKTTTMKMLAGLLQASAGEILLFGKPVDATDIQTRFRVGYMSQSFSLYTHLTVAQNLDLHAHLFHLNKAAGDRIESLVTKFGLGAYLHQKAADLPLGIRQRLSLAVAVVHMPEILILDEPTSGVDPLARDQFWELLTDLSRNDGITIFISTHFMNEAARCDRIALMDAGQVLALGRPEDLISARGCSNLEDAFIDYLEKAHPAQQDGQQSSTTRIMLTEDKRPSASKHRRFSLQRLLAYTVRESLELVRDRIRLGFALLGTAFLMSVFGVGISTDVNNLSIAFLDRDHSHASRTYLEDLRGSAYFTEKAPIKNQRELEARLQSGDIKAAIEIPPHFGRDIKKGVPTEVGAWVDGAMPFRAETIRGYLIAVHQQYLSDYAVRNGQAAVNTSDDLRYAKRNKNVAMPGNATTNPAALARVETRFLYNQNFESIYAQVPGSIALLLVMIPAILMALAIVREKEMGSITNLYVTPVTRIEFLIGKQIPYIAIAMVNFAIMCLLGIFLFGVPLRGSLPALCLGALLYVTATTALGMLISAFCKTQIAALFGTAILTMLPATTFSGMLTPVSSMEGLPALIGRSFPMTYFLKISVGTFTKALGFRDLSFILLQIALFVPIFTILSLLLLRKQES